MKKQHISNKMQEVAVDILMRLVFVKDINELTEVFEYVYDKYELLDDPFTQLPCARKEYAELSYSYDKQKALEIYGYNNWF